MGRWEGCKAWGRDTGGCSPAVRPLSAAHTGTQAHALPPGPRAAARGRSCSSGPASSWTSTGPGSSSGSLPVSAAPGGPQPDLFAIRRGAGHAEVLPSALAAPGCPALPLPAPAAAPAAQPALAPSHPAPSPWPLPPTTRALPCSHPCLGGGEQAPGRAQRRLLPLWSLSAAATPILPPCGPISAVSFPASACTPWQQGVSPACHPGCSAPAGVGPARHCLPLLLAAADHHRGRHDWLLVLRAPRVVPVRRRRACRPRALRRLSQRQRASPRAAAVPPVSACRSLCPLVLCLNCSLCMPLVFVCTGRKQLVLDGPAYAAPWTPRRPPPLCLAACFTWGPSCLLLPAALSAVPIRGSARPADVCVDALTCLFAVWAPAPLLQLPLPHWRHERPVCQTVDDGAAGAARGVFK